ncbi:MAG: Hint domain-containing protein [Pseudomonadota bacterium]
MALRSFFAIDNNNLVVDSSSNGSIVGNPVINNSDTPDGTIFTYSAGGGTTVTLDDTGGNVDTFEDDNTAGHNITDGGGIVANGTPVEAESLIFVRALDSFGNPTGPTITITVFSQNGVTGDVWGFSPDIQLQDGVQYVKTGGSNTGSSAYNTFITCFGADTRILTENGETTIDTLCVGDRVWTLDKGFQPVRWIGHTEVTAEGSFAPVVIPQGAIGNSRELVVSQEHRLYMQAPEAELLFGTRDVLLAAKHLCGKFGIRIRTGGTVTYVHMMFDRHQIVQSEGALSESFFLSRQSLSAVDADQRRELLSLFPSLTSQMARFGETAAPTLKRHEAALLVTHLSKRAA